MTETKRIGQLKNQKKKCLYANFTAFLDYYGTTQMSDPSNSKKHEVWLNFLKWFYDSNDLYYQNLYGLKSTEFKEPFKSVLEGNYYNNQNLDYFLSNKNELEKLLKLYYFGQNVGDIKSILQNLHDPNYKVTCQYVNECLHLFRELKRNYCPKGVPSDYSSNTVCNQLGEFANRYEYTLYEPLKRHNKMSSVDKYPDAAQVRCELTDSLFYTPFWSLYKANVDEFTVFGNFVVAGFVMFAVYLILLILYKFTPIGLRFNPEGQRKARRIWRKVEMEQARNNRGEYSDDDESLYSDNEGSSNTFVYGNNRYY
ncbi:variable surface protein [Plasmodium gonderi]|uniref:Variable surface protein n=1 Tax=Plasmodium gonderi TaxID=77519 RepID=A0A1Y1J959_PLAGO|nr:variable surface protein [Plasmodium gonderi]GAW79049.1 variable surface protein [Plasmodium gonderi]